MTSRFSPAAVFAFELAFNRWMKRRLRDILMTGLSAKPAPDRPLLLVANHVSWWDGFIARQLQTRLRPGGSMYSVMSAHELSRWPFLRLMGAVGIHTGSARGVRSALSFLRRVVDREPAATVLYFPQGRIWPSHRRPLAFQPGVATFARHLGTTVLPVGIHMEPLNHPAPTAFVSVGNPLEPNTDVDAIEGAVQREVDALLAFVAWAGEDSPSRWPGPERPLSTMSFPAAAPE